MITHAAPGGTFWDLVRKGAEAAAKDNVDLDFVSDPDGADQADLIRKAVEEKVDGIAVTLAKPDAMRSAIASARKERIPVVGLNSGIDAWEAQHLLAYFGQDENAAEQALGRRLNVLGAKHVACVIHERGNTAKLRRDPSVDEVVTLGAPFALTAVESVSDAGSGAEVATFDLNKDLVKAVRGGRVQLAVDQQPYLQGYLAVDSLWLYKSSGNYSGGGVAPVLTARRSSPDLPKDALAFRPGGIRLPAQRGRSSRSARIGVHRGTAESDLQQIDEIRVEGPSLALCVGGQPGVKSGRKSDACAHFMIHTPNCSARICP